MVEFDYDILYVHQPSLKKNTNTWVCAECVKPCELKNCKAVHYTTKGLDCECFCCKCPNLDTLYD